MALMPFSELEEDDQFIVPNETITRLRVKKKNGDGYAYGMALPGNVPAYDIHLRENDRDIFSCDPNLMVIWVRFEPMSN